MTYVALSGAELRYVLMNELFESETLTVSELGKALEEKGFAPAGRPSKAISDALRWETRRGRVYRRGRARYGPGEIPQSSMYYIRARLHAIGIRRTAI
ncbi:hypothetical protein [Nocardia sp. XZ_19_385]|uniref:hypothetical protein n=1 Tax=Nocardia sp. XZ_19_385 TaxID=2769488 RepID=UPI00188F7BAD|nr:hypothetical protein [Nocardia sp. XZ_19_385]